MGAQCRRVHELRRRWRRVERVDEVSNPLIREWECVDVERNHVFRSSEKDADIERYFVAKVRR